MNLKIIDIELGLADIEEIPEKYMPISNVIFFYFHERDWIVFNPGHPDHDIYLDIVKAYLELGNLQRKELYENVEHVAETALPCIRMLNNILRIRRRRMKAYEN